MATGTVVCEDMMTRPRDERIIWLYVWDCLMVSRHPARIGGHRHFGSADMIYLMVEGQDFTYSRVNPPLLFISKA